MGFRIRLLRARAARDLEPESDFYLTVAELCDRALEIDDAVDQDRLISLEMLGEQRTWRMRVQLHHRHTCPERLDREDHFRAQLMGEVRDVGCNITAREVDEVEPIERGESLRR